MYSIVLIGNCQIRALYQMYNRFVGAAKRQTLKFIASYETITPADRTTIEGADLVVEQLLDQKPSSDVAGIRTTAERVLVPLVNCGFLWPFAGQPHPVNPMRPYLETGPYGAETSDAWLNRTIKSGVEPKAAVERYLDLDVNAEVNLDRLQEIGLARQRRRDDLTGFNIADLIAEHFRDEPVFLTPYHPDVLVAVALARQFFERLGVVRSDIEAMQRAIRITPFPKDELPIHPAVVRHFGLRFVPDDRRWRFMNEGSFTTREFYLRYMGCVWNEPLAAGLAQSASGNVETARENLEAGLRITADAAAGHAALAHVLMRQGLRNDAVAAVKQAIAIDPNHAPYRAQLGGLLRSTDPDAAEQELRAAFELDPFDPHIPGLMANFLRAHDRVAEALAVVRKGLDESPYATNLHVELGHLLARTGDKASAERAFRRARELDPMNLASVFALLDVLEQQGNTAGATVLLEEAQTMVRDQPDPQAYRDLFRLLLRFEKGEAAEMVAREALDLFPNEARLWTEFGEVLGRAGRLDEAVAATTRAIELAPDLADAHLRLGELATRQGHLAAAEAALRNVLKLDRDRAHPYAQLGYVLSAQGRHVEAIRMRERAVEIEPSNPYRHAQLSHVLMEAGNFVGAARTIRRAIRMAPEVAIFHIDFGHILSRAGKFKAAIAQARKAIRLSPECADFQSFYLDLCLRVGDLASAEAGLRE